MAATGELTGIPSRDWEESYADRRDVNPKAAFLTLPLNSAWTGHLETTNSTWRPRGAPAYTQKHQSQLLKVESMPTRLTGSQFQQAPLQENK